MMQYEHNMTHMMNAPVVGAQEDGQIPVCEGGEQPMRLKSDFITQDIDDTQFLVPVGAEAFSGIVRSNKTAALIVDLLKEDTTEEEIIDALYAEYDAPRETIVADVKSVLDTLRSIRALDEG